MQADTAPTTQAPDAPRGFPMIRCPLCGEEETLAVQVHSVDPPHPFVLRSIELVAEGVAPAFGWRREAPAETRRAA